MIAIPLFEEAGPLFRQVYDGLRRAILSGAFPAGERLPSTRDLAEQLGVSRTVVLTAYDQLSAEGFVVGRGGSGTYVSDQMEAGLADHGRHRAVLPLSRFGAAASALDMPKRRPVRHRHDFTYGRSDLACFPFALWRRLLLRQARLASANQFDYGPAIGSPALRTAICGHLRRSRAVHCDPEDVIVVNGSQQALDLIARVLVEPGDSVAIEDPHYDATREVLRAAGARLCPVPVDRDGLDPDSLPAQARLAFVTPSHQFPTGAILPLARRLALLDWARRANAVIVEDDYDGEFHYAGRPLESLQGLDREGRIIYVGTFSRTVFPALRIGYLIPPKSLVRAFAAAKLLNDLHSATLEQETLATFVADGHYERHLRRLRSWNAGRRARLLAAIADHLGGKADVTGDGSGAHVVIWPRSPIGEEEGIARAASRGVGIYPTSHCYLIRPAPVGFILGYAQMDEAEIEAGVALLGEVF